LVNSLITKSGLRVKNLVNSLITKSGLKVTKLQINK
jgi:hypothetical protein